MLAELPELTVYAETLRSLVVGLTIADSAVHQPRVLRGLTADQLGTRLEGRRLSQVARRGKMLAFLLGDGDRLDVHLMLGGEIYHFGPGGRVKVPQPVLTLRFGDGSSLRFSDQHFDPLKPSEPKMWVGINRKEHAGVDPTDPAFTSEALAALCRKKQLLPIKALLCDQRLIGGLGNAYADEVLWEARVRPRRAASLMTPEEVARVHDAIGRVLARATEELRRLIAGRLQGEPRRDFLQVHHRSRKPCPRCGERIVFETFRDRPTNWCPACQT